MKRSLAVRLAAIAFTLALPPLLATTTAIPAAAQRVIVAGGPNGGFVIAELGAVIADDEAKDAARVEHTFDVEQRAAAYRDVDLASGDRVLAVNGKRVRSASDLEDAYKAIAVGQQVELGVERKGAGAAQRSIVKFAKADAATLPQRRMVRIEADPDSDVDPMPALGAVVSQKHAKGSPVQVLAVLPNGDAVFQQGDHLISLDGKAVTTLADFGDRWDAIPVGAKVTLVLENGGKRRTATFDRREAPAGQQQVIHH